MSSILTNTSAMVALQTLNSINTNLSKTQEMISSGKKVANAKDNSAIFAISKVMESDVTGFKAISESLSLGQSTVAVARNASETVTDLLTQMKDKIVSAQDSNVDRTKINDDVTQIKNQIKSVVSAAQFNGLNLIDGNTASTDVLASLDRDSSGNVTSSRSPSTARISPPADIPRRPPLPVPTVLPSTMPTVSASRSTGMAAPQMPAPW